MHQIFHEIICCTRISSKECTALAPMPHAAPWQLSSAATTAPDCSFISIHSLRCNDSHSTQHQGIAYSSSLPLSIVVHKKLEEYLVITIQCFSTVINGYNYSTQVAAYLNNNILVLTISQATEQYPKYVYYRSGDGYICKGRGMMS